MHRIWYSTNEYAHINMVRAGVNHIANCECGWRSKGTRYQVGKHAVHHMKRETRFGNESRSPRHPEGALTGGRES